MAAKSLALQVGVAPACRALGVPRATFYRRHRSTPGRQQPRCTPARATVRGRTRTRFLETLSIVALRSTARHAEVVATLLDEGQYLCSERTMYRILAASQPVRERRNQLTHAQLHQARAGRDRTERNLVVGYHAPSGTETLDVLLPVRVARHLQPICGRVDGRRTESSALAARLIEQTCLKQGIEPETLTLHSDRGAPMTTQVHRATARRPRGDPLAQPPPGQRRQPLLRGAVQDPEVPPRLPRGGSTTSRPRPPSAVKFFPWYNTEHRHVSGSRCSPHMTSTTCQARQVLEQRERTLRLAWNRHPERFVHGTPKPQPLPQEVWINPPIHYTISASPRSIAGFAPMCSIRRLQFLPR